MTSPMQPVDAIALIDAAWIDWMAALASVPESRWSEAGVCGEWSIKDLLGHIAVWDDLTVQYLKNLGSGVKMEPLDWEALNTKEAALRADRTIDQQRGEMNASHAAMHAFVANTTGIDLTVIAVNTWEHYPEHTVQVMSWGEQN